MTTTISDLKAQLGTGMGLRKNKYLVELPWGSIDGSKFNILCKSASVPQRDLDIQTVWHHGRKYNVRAETNYPGDWTVTVYDDSDFTLRKYFDTWMTYIDDSSSFFQIAGEQSSNSSSSPFGHISDAISTVTSTYNAIKNFSISGAVSAIKSSIADSVSGVSGTTIDYQTLINVWQLDGNGTKVYGYQLQNAFPKSLGSIQYDDSEQDSIVEYDVTFAYSEFVPLQGGSDGRRIANALVGNTIANLF